MRIEFEMARLQFETASENLKLRTLTAPFDGLIVERYRDLGETVSTAQKVFRLVDLSKVYIKCLARPDRVSHIPVGQKVSVHFPQMESAGTYPAEVVLIDPCADSSGLLRMKLLVVNPEGRIHSGLKALVDLGDNHAQAPPGG
jgi:multidrug resistance efflux pump